MRFPTDKLAKPKFLGKEPTVVVACGSYSPISFLHLRMFELARDYFKAHMKQHELIGGYLSPVADAYGKKGLVAGSHRVKMCQLATESSDFIMLDPWEAGQSKHVLTSPVLQHFDDELNKEGGILMPDGTKRRIHIMLLAGADLIESFGVPGLWADEHLHDIVGNRGCVIIEREGSDAQDFMLKHDILFQHRENVYFVRQTVSNDVSSTKLRLFAQRGLSLKYLTDDKVVDYIEENKLWQ
jgi:nicotinamide mononucleotide adenylyltransferase